MLRDYAGMLEDTTRLLVKIVQQPGRGVTQKEFATIACQVSYSQLAGQLKFDEVVGWVETYIMATCRSALARKRRRADS